MEIPIKDEKKVEKGYKESADIDVNDLPIVETFTSFEELVGFITGAVGRNNLIITKFEAKIKIEAQ